MTRENIFSDNRIYSVTDFGAKGDGVTDDTKAFLDTWNATCQSSVSSILLIPAGKTFLLNPIVFQGPCQFYVRVQTLALLFCSRALVAGLRLINSPQMHLVVGFSSAIHITGVTITAPGDSLNTDGIHIQQSRHVIISDSTIGTGDDCISIGTGSFHVNVSWVTCGPGHGISVGSLGMDNSRAEVSDIQVGHCNIFSTMNGVRIKTWQGGYGYAKTIIFENINFTAVMNPIIIDQHYCAAGVCAEKSSAVQVTDVRFIEVRGTSSSQVAINLNCSQNVACTGITIQNVEIQPAQQGGQASSYCFNAHGTVTGVAMPALEKLADRENEIDHHMLEKRVGVSALLHEGREDVVVVPAVSELQLPGLDAKLEPSTCATLHVSVASMATWSHLLNRQTNSRKMKRWRLATAALSKAIAEAFSRRSSASVSGSLPKARPHMLSKQA
uniref:Polygalacturonase n=1 Tax=Musa acuminata subsp. malaccensis TaxID=214687 RepID=A0A804ILQ1_MUSAM